MSQAARLPAARRRRQLLDVAQEVFAEQGFHATSMDVIAEAAGVTKPVLYQHFDSKRLLYLELLEDVGQQLLDAITTATARARSPREQVEHGFTAYFRFVAERRSAFRLLFGGGSRRDEEFGDTVGKVETAISEVIATLIETNIDTEHRRLLAHGIVSLAEGTAHYWLTNDLDVGPDVMAARIANLAWAGLRAVHP